ncbi:MAG TPA: hypothetical protein VF362_01080 [Demequinaceae bacterium]
MSDATDDLPSQAELDANSLPAFLRRAPRLARIIAIGAGIGFVFGVVIALGLPGHGASYRAVVALLVGLGLAMVGALTAAAIATRPDGRDSRAGAPSWPGMQAIEDAVAAEGKSEPQPGRDG